MPCVDDLLKENMHLVKKVVRRYFPRYSQDEDLTQCGLIGLWEAAKHWDGRGEFAPYAILCIRHNMIDYIRAGRKMVQLEEPLQDNIPEQGSEMQDDPDGLHLLKEIKTAWPEQSRERKMLILLMSGISKREACKRLGVSRQTGSRIAKRAWGKVKKQKEAPT